MLIEPSTPWQTLRNRVLRRALYYGFTVAVALLCSYWILQGHW
jgi:hypothetical protein